LRLRWCSNHHQTQQLSVLTCLLVLPPLLLLLLLLLQMSTLEAEVASKQAQLTALSAENAALNAKARALDQLLASAGEAYTCWGLPKRRVVTGWECISIVHVAWGLAPPAWHFA
jgi:hypothetical protein